MSSREMAFILFACIFGSTLLGLLLGKVLPDRHLESDSKDIVKLATGLIATLSALVLGLLISSAKQSFGSDPPRFGRIATPVGSAAATSTNPSPSKSASATSAACTD